MPRGLTRIEKTSRQIMPSLPLRGARVRPAVQEDSRIRGQASMKKASADLGVLIAVNIVLAAVYFVAGKLGLALAFVHVSASAVWPPTGIALAACMRWGFRVCPGIFAGAFLVNLTTEGTAATSLGIATGNMLEALVGAFLVNRFAHGSRAFERPRDVFKFALLAGAAGTLLSPTIGVSCLWLGGFAPREKILSIWLTWWLGDAVGALLFAPPLILWARRPKIDWVTAEFIKTVLFILALLVLGQAVFGWLFSSVGTHYPLLFAFLPIMIWSAFQFRQRGTATAMLLLSGVAIWGTLRGAGQFVSETREPDMRPHESLLVLQAFLGLTSITALALAAVVAQRDRIEKVLREAHVHLDQRIKERTTDLVNANEALSLQITERRQVEAKLRQSERLAVIGETMAGLAHESRNALQQSQACLELLALKERDRPEIQGLAADIQKALDHLHHLYEEVRRYAAPINLKRESCDLGQLLRESWGELGPLHKGRANKLEQTANSVNLISRVDRLAMGQVFCRILENSLAACNGPVEVRANWTEAMHDGKPALQLSLQDNSGGLTREARQKLFKPFFTTKTQGTGLGLAIARRIVEAHNGQISLGPNASAGTEILVTIPRHCDEPFGEDSGCR